MKKTYITPAVETKEIAVETMIAASVEYAGELTKETYSDAKERDFKAEAAEEVNWDEGLW